MRAFLYKTGNPSASCQPMRQACAVAVMCPAMSLAAAALFFGALGGTPVFQLPAAWAGSVLKHFPLAFFPEYVRRGPFCPLGLPAAVCRQKLTATAWFAPAAHGCRTARRPLMI